MRDVFILDAVRTPRGRGKAGKGALSGVHPQELLAQALNRLVKRSGLAAGDVEDVVIGCVSEVNEQGANIARNSVLAAGWPDSATGVTLNRFCGSGAQAVNFAAMGVMSGQQELVVAGGVESMSRAPSRRTASPRASSPSSISRASPSSTRTSTRARARRSRRSPSWSLPSSP